MQVLGKGPPVLHAEGSWFYLQLGLNPGELLLFSGDNTELVGLMG